MTTYSEVWSPQPKQALALQAPVDELFFGGAKGGGKSDYLLADYAAGIPYGEAWGGIIIRKSYPNLEELLKRSKQLYPKIGGVWKETTRTWTFPSGAALKFRFLESDNDVEEYQGHQYAWIGFDELPQFATDYCYTVMLSCLRSASGAPGRIRASGNPGNVGQAWVKRRFIDPMRPMEIYVDPDTELTRVFIPARLEDNHILVANDPKYERRLLALKATQPHLYRAFRLGDWDLVEGAAFADWDRNIHITKPYPLSPFWYKAASLDWGYAKPFSIGFHAVTDEGRAIRFSEMYGCEPGKHNMGVKKSTIEVAREAWKVATTYGIEDLVADPACWAKHGTGTSERVTSVIDAFKEVGFKCHRAMNDRVAGIQVVHRYLQDKDSHGRPMLEVFDTCSDFTRTIGLLVPDKHKPEDVNTDGEDHAFDDQRYFLTSHLVKKRGMWERRRKLHESMSNDDVLMR